MMVLLRNVSGGLVMVGERYLFPGETRLVDEATAAAVLASSPGLLVASHPDHVGSRLELLFQEDGGAVADAPGSEDKALLSSDDLTVIRGIGPRTAEALVLVGVDSYAGLAAADAVELAAALDGASRGQVERWIVQAQDLAAEES